MTFGFPKLGLVSAPRLYLGRRGVVVDIGIPKRSSGRTRSAPACWIPAACCAWPSPSRAGSQRHTWASSDRGGLAGKLGAAILATRAALRSGVGLCTLAASEAVAQGLGTAVLEAMSLPIRCRKKRCRQHWTIYGHLAARRTTKAIAIGPGLPVSPLSGRPALAHRKWRQQDGARCRCAESARRPGWPLAARCGAWSRAYADAASG